MLRHQHVVRMYRVKQWNHVRTSPALGIEFSIFFQIFHSYTQVWFLIHIIVFAAFITWTIAYRYQT